MSESGHKRKRSLQDSPVDLLKMRMALSRLEALKEELDGIQETEEELKTISAHVLALENILKSAKKPAGVTSGRLVFEPAKLSELTEGLTANTEAEIADLHSRIKKIYAHVNMDVSGSRMILDAILLALAEIASTQKRGVAILPEMRIGQGDGVQISHPDSGYELWLSGSVDYVVIDYEDVRDYKKRLVGPGGSRQEVALDISKGRLFLVEAKHQSAEKYLISCIPEAISQGIALLKSANLPEVRFCLSDGQTWIFFILKLAYGTLTYYESASYRLSRDVLENSDLPLREIVQLVCEWLRPSTTDLFTLE
ncbi:hypothetical protein DFH94DRAFT_640978 [Russula ochroleuca]|uniref:Uncharacterized protein n=1 Tax=Russula ochroleuca TaxID=152965 RepID=A0A9P5JUE1_9AGAM|nr:hypothetical protein DFH94DRAFT_640978 [Russula ochroleuca]